MILGDGMDCIGNCTMLSSVLMLQRVTHRVRGKWILPLYR